jgi:8-oxo-dGTP diphosphatase
MTEVQRQLVAARAIIEKDGNFLIIRESSRYDDGTKTGKYDFPGGRVKVGESIQASLERETEEEVGLKVKVGRPFFVDEWKPVIKGEQVQIIGIFFICETFNTEVKLSTDHDDYKWVSLSEYDQFPLVLEVKKAFDVLVSSR